MSLESDPLGQRRKLTAELAVRDPETYKNILFAGLRAETKLAGSVWDYYVQKGVFDERTIVLEPNTWTGETRQRANSDAFTIRLGTEPLSKKQKRKLIFSGSPIDDKSYLLSHEISHVLGGDATAQIKKARNVYQTLTEMRQSGRGLSALGSLDFYAAIGPAEQAKEDLVELFNMYLISPAYLKAYLAYLSDPKLQAEHSVAKLTQIDVSVADHIGRTIANCVDQLLEER